MCLKNFLLKQTSSKINNSGEKFCNNLSCFFLTTITPVLLSGYLLNYTGCSIITSRTIRVKSRILKQFLLYFKTLSNLEQCPTWVRSPLLLFIMFSKTLKNWRGIIFCSQDIFISVCDI